MEIKTCISDAVSSHSDERTVKINSPRTCWFHFPESIFVWPIVDYNLLQGSVCGRGFTETVIGNPLRMCNLTSYETLCSDISWVTVDN